MEIQDEEKKIDTEQAYFKKKLVAFAANGETRTIRLRSSDYGTVK